jgi:hypothetical protein
VTYRTITMKGGDCDRCAGCGYLDDGEMQPFKYWLELPVQSAVALQMGLVKPVECPDCRATGNAQSAGGNT